MGLALEEAHSKSIVEDVTVVKRNHGGRCGIASSRFAGRGGRCIYAMNQSEKPGYGYQLRGATV